MGLDVAMIIGLVIVSYTAYGWVNFSENIAINLVGSEGGPSSISLGQAFSSNVAATQLKKHGLDNESINAAKQRFAAGLKESRDAKADHRGKGLGGGPGGGKAGSGAGGGGSGGGGDGGGQSTPQMGGAGAKKGIISSALSGISKVVGGAGAAAGDAVADSSSPDIKAGGAARWITTNYSCGPNYSYGFGSGWRSPSIRRWCGARWIPINYSCRSGSS
jgi:hypothetical protein